MNVLLILILASLAIAILFLCAFIWAVTRGQYEDTFTPSMRILLEEESAEPITARPDRGSPGRHGTNDSIHHEHQS